MSINQFELSVEVSEAYPFNQSSLAEIERNTWVKNQWPLVYFLRNEKIKKAYIGESTNAASRLRNHLANPKKADVFQTVNIIGSDKFNKSATLDIESQLIQYINAEGTYTTDNLNLGLQNHSYYQQHNYKNLFYTIWEKLIEKQLVSKSLKEIENSELFKYSPYKSLSEDQYKSVIEILKQLNEVERNSIFISGSAGTGKTVLATYLLKLLKSDIDQTTDAELSEDDIYEIQLIRNYQQKFPKAKIGFVVAMTSLRETLKNVFTLVPGLNKNMVVAPSETFNGDKYDLLIVDESHRLRQYKNISWRGVFKQNNLKLGLDDTGTELDWIMNNSKNQIFFYDASQSVKPSDIDESRFLKLFNLPTTKKLALKTQMRSKGGADFISFVSKLLLCETSAIPELPEEFELNYYSDFNKLYEDLKIKENEMGLCRMVAGYSWPWVSDKDKTKFDIELDGLEFQWNHTAKDWINSPLSNEQIGCIHTTQGYDLNYVAVIFGREIDYNPQTNKLEINRKLYFDKNGKNGVKNDEDLAKYILNIYKTILCRGIRGVYIYACNEQLKKHFTKIFSKGDILTSNDITQIKRAPRIIPFEHVKPYVNAVPLYDIKIAASNFTDPQIHQELQWVELPMNVAVKNGYFVAQVIGESMNKIIPNGSYCLFKEYTGGSRNGEIVLAQHLDLQDPDYSGRYTIKEYESRKNVTEEGWRHESIVLKPLSYEKHYKEIILQDEDLIHLSIRGLFVMALSWE